VGWSMTLKALAPRLRCSQCGKKAEEVRGSGETQAAGYPEGSDTEHLAAEHREYAPGRPTKPDQGENR
jgi:hypothetical protein